MPSIVATIAPGFDPINDLSWFVRTGCDRRMIIERVQPANGPRLASHGQCLPTSIQLQGSSPTGLDRDIDIFAAVKSALDRSLGRQCTFLFGIAPLPHTGVDDDRHCAGLEQFGKGHTRPSSCCRPSRGGVAWCSSGALSTRRVIRPVEGCSAVNKRILESHPAPWGCGVAASSAERLYSQPDIMMATAEPTSPTPRTHTDFWLRLPIRYPRPMAFRL